MIDGKTDNERCVLFRTKIRTCYKGRSADRKGFTGYFHKSILQQNTEGVSYRLFAVRKELFKQWNPDTTDVTEEELMLQLCSFVKKSGYRISYVPSATAALKREG